MRKGAANRPSKVWDEATFFAELERKDGTLCATARAILEWARPRVSRIWWGRGAYTASFVPIVQRGSTKYQLFSVHTGWASTPPGIELPFQYYATKPGFEAPDRRIQLLQKFNAIAGVALPAESIDRRPNIPLSVVAPAESLRAFFDAAEWQFGEISRSD